MKAINASIAPARLPESQAAGLHPGGHGVLEHGVLGVPQGREQEKGPGAKPTPWTLCCCPFKTHVEAWPQKVQPLSARSFRQISFLTPMDCLGCATS